MKKQLKAFTALSLGCFSCLLAEGAPAAEATPAQSGDIAKISEAFGHLIGKNLETIGVKFDMAQVIKGLQDETAGKDSPMSEMEVVQAISAVQERLFKEQSAENLKKAETFLADSAKTEGIVALQEGKVLYRVEQKGTGEAIQSDSSPLIRYTGKYLDGTVFGASKEDEMLSLDEIIPGLKSGLVGMKEGEKRTIFIHPELAYGTNGYLPPNSLLTFEIEVIKANAPQQKPVESISTTEDSSPATKGSPEIAEPGTTHIR
jgi:peptidylprolyl isomerase